MRNSRPPRVPICDVQGSGIWSDFAGRDVTVEGVVTGVGRRGFYIQNAERGPDPKASDAVYVFSRGWSAPKGALVAVTGKVLDYVKTDNGKPVTQIKLDRSRVIKSRGPAIKPFKLTADNVPADPAELAVFLNSLEGMLVSIDPGHTFIAPSNPYGDYVLLLDGEGPLEDVSRTSQGGVLVDHGNPLRWYPGFRIADYARAPRLNVGSKLLSQVSGPLNYRVEAFQIIVDHEIEVEPYPYSLGSSHLNSVPGSVTIMTMNGFNLDRHVESPSMVKSPRQDVDDDWGDGRFHGLAAAVINQANTPDIVALQEIQDNDGAEMSMVIDASKTYLGLIEAIGEISDIEYKWIDIAPAVGADGGQPGGGIRNGYLYNPKRVELIEDTVRSIGRDEPAFEGSRKPLLAHFKELDSGRELVCINVHFASKRHQFSIFAPEQPGYDARQSNRIEQAEIVREELLHYLDQGQDYYVTGDFNDTEESQTLSMILGEESANLVEKLAPEQRYDYNHRGKLQALMHGIVPRHVADGRAEYDIIHGNELLGVQPGELGDKPTDHAYVVARIKMT